MALLDIFVGVPQSKFAAIAILVALVAVAFAILFGKDSLPVGQKFVFVLLLFVTSLPALLLALFQLTCLVTGAGLKNQRWWCGAYAWLGTILIILYAVVIVTVTIMSLVSGSNIMTDLAIQDAYKNYERFEDAMAAANGVAATMTEPTSDEEEMKKMAEEAAASVAPPAAEMVPTETAPTAEGFYADALPAMPSMLGPFKIDAVKVAGAKKEGFYTGPTTVSADHTGVMAPAMAPKTAPSKTAVAVQAPAASTPEQFSNYGAAF